MTIFKETQDLINDLIENRGTVLILGDRGTGKTFLCEEIINSLTLRKIQCAYIDANISGAGGNIGKICLYIFDEPGKIKETKPLKEYFIGSMTNKGHGIDIIFGISRLIKYAKKQGCQTVLAETFGEYNYASSVIFVQNEIDALYPDYLVGVQQGHEIEFALCPFAKRDGLKIGLIEKPQKAYYNRNIEQFSKKISLMKQFKNCSNHLVLMGAVSFTNTWLGNGRELKWQYLRQLSEIAGAEVLHAEIAYNTLFVFSNAKPTEIMIHNIKNYLHVGNTVFQPVDMFSGLYVGLHNENKELLGVGLIENILFKKNTMIIRSNILSAEPVKEIKFGFIKTNPTADYIEQI